MKKPEGMKGESLKSRKKVCNVQNSDETQQDMTEAIRIAVRKAFAEVKIEEKRAEKKKTLYNTRRLMESYIDLKNTSIMQLRRKKKSQKRHTAS